jgi:hypothetical protein
MINEDLTHLSMRNSSQEKSYSSTQLLTGGISRIAEIPGARAMP